MYIYIYIYIYLAIVLSISLADTREGNSRKPTQSAGKAMLLQLYLLASFRQLSTVLIRTLCSSGLLTLS